MVSNFAPVLATAFCSSLPHPELTLIRGLKEVHPDLRVVYTTESREPTFPYSGLPELSEDTNGDSSE